MFAGVKGKPLPGWAQEIDCASWAQVFLKFILGHPAVTCVIPGTRNAGHLADNLGAARGRLPDAALRARMAAYFDSI
jgi:aryl-alcohol dehydrogenase-like predicted oxidoreductase